MFESSLVIQLNDPNFDTEYFVTYRYIAEAGHGERGQGGDRLPAPAHQERVWREKDLSEFLDITNNEEEESIDISSSESETDTILENVELRNFSDLY